MCKNGWGFVSGHFFMRIGITKTYMDAPVISTHYLSLRADFQHVLRLILLLPLVCCAEGSLKNGPLFKLGLTYIQALY
ncbi:MAG: hypothetical protein ACI9MS_002928 [Glaciecola sp.]